VELGPVAIKATVANTTSEHHRYEKQNTNQTTYGQELLSRRTRFKIRAATLYRDTLKSYCQVCVKNFESIEEKKKHCCKNRSGRAELEKKVQKYSNKCFLCDAVHSNRRGLVDHMHRVHPGQFFECKHRSGKCARVFRTEEEKMEHVLNDHIPSRKCSFCHRTFHKSGLAAHMENYHKSENLIRCSNRSCGTYFRSNEEKQKHDQLIHAGKGKKLCIFCGLFIFYNNMVQHFKYKHKHQVASAFKCTFRCGEYFLTEAERDEHVGVHTKVAKVRQEVVCIYCNKICADKEALLSHSKHNHSDITIQCRIRGCSLFFLTQTQLDAHFEQVHRKKEDNKRFRCSMCDYRSIEISKLNSHLALMHGNKNKPCLKCGKCFISTEALKFHLNVSHAESKICEHCNRSMKYLHGHQIQSKCKECQQILPCRQSAQLHSMSCKLSTMNNK